MSQHDRVLKLFESRYWAAQKPSSTQTCSKNTQTTLSQTTNYQSSSSGTSTKFFSHKNSKKTTLNNRVVSTAGTRKKKHRREVNHVDQVKEDELKLLRSDSNDSL
jgi:hypothetical protein